MSVRLPACLSVSCRTSQTLWDQLLSVMEHTFIRPVRDSVRHWYWPRWYCLSSTTPRIKFFTVLDRKLRWHFPCNFLRLLPTLTKHWLQLLTAWSQWPHVYPKWPHEHSNTVERILTKLHTHVWYISASVTQYALSCFSYFTTFRWLPRTWLYHSSEHFWTDFAHTSYIRFLFICFVFQKCNCPFSIHYHATHTLFPPGHPIPPHMTSS